MPAVRDTTPPLWLLDIDGVVNALARSSVPDTWPRDAWVERVVITAIPQRGVMTLPILAAHPVLDFITDVARSGAAQIQWHSTWRAVAMSSFAPTLGLPQLAVSVAPEWTDRPIGTWWKLGAAQRALDAGRRLVWTDDDISAYGEQVAQLDGIGSDETALLISPDPTTGLDPEHLDRIRAFLDR